MTDSNNNDSEEVRAALRRTSLLHRRYYYGTGLDDTIHAYSREEWGIGGSQPGGNYSTHTISGLVLVTALMTLPAVFSPAILFLAMIQLNPTIALIALICTGLFTGGWLLGLHSLRNEMIARKLRNRKGLPKPRFAVTDDQARFWFEKNPGKISITPENFPDSTLPFPTEEIHE